MEEILERIKEIERQNQEILSLLRTMRCAEQLEEAVENMRKISMPRHPYLDKQTLAKVK